MLYFKQIGIVHHFQLIFHDNHEVRDSFGKVHGFHNIVMQNDVVSNTLQYNTIQYNTIQYSTIQNNTIQYNCDGSLLKAMHFAKAVPIS